MIPCVENKVLDTFTPNAVPLKPEAPWIKKCSFGIKFTDEIFYTDDERENTPDEEKEYNKKKSRGERERQDDTSEPTMNYVRSRSEEVELKRNIFVPEAEVQPDEEILDGGAEEPVHRQRQAAGGPEYEDYEVDEFEQ